MIKYIFCDLDGTLYKNGISEEDVKAIKKFEENGGIFNIATGRIFKQGYNMIKKCFSLNGYFIAENGSFIYNSDLDMIFKGTINDELAKEIIDEFHKIDKNKEADAQIYFKYKGETVVLTPSSAFSTYSKDFIVDPEFDKRDSFDNMIGNIGVVCNDEDELIMIEEKLKDNLKDKVDIYFSSETTINLVPKGVSKKDAIEFLLKKDNINPKEVATIGDSPNDISMISGFENGFAMSNGREDVKKSAKYIVDSVSEAIDITLNIK
ncbi:Cof-type HAD-IIB family hydrolase [Peptacetobacter sp.]|uniref:Cof-type HAD-IIB family hydrolase n=1 Tax=Peptacetobacter sp. TaxID=2991975 RepID=UPI002624BE14|nr:Cof-type HAD-IIB family hydrolase [Peptacetobacter sp.]